MATTPQKQQKTHSLTEEVYEKIRREPHGHQSLLIENLLRSYYGMPQIEEERLDYRVDVSRYVTDD